MSRSSSGGSARLNLLDVESGHVRELGARPARALTFMDFPWSFSRRDYCWAKDGSLYFAEDSDRRLTIGRLKPEGGLETVWRLDEGEGVRDLTSSADGSSFFFVRNTGSDPAGTVVRVSGGRAASLFSARQGWLMLLGHSKEGLLVAHQERLDAPVRVLSLAPGGAPREILQFRAVPSSWRLVESLNAIAFSRRDARDVENIFLKDLATGVETAVTENGIQGIAFSPVSDSGRGLLAFSQQLRNKDLGIIRIDR